MDDEHLEWLNVVQAKADMADELAEALRTINDVRISDIVSDPEYVGDLLRGTASDALAKYDALKEGK